MEAVKLGNKFHPHSSYTNSSSFSNTHFGLIKFRKTHIGFEPKIPKKWTSLSLCGGERLKKEIFLEKKQRDFSVKCTAEGIERGLLVGGRSDEERKFVVAERFKVVALMACVMCLCNADRVVMSVAIVPLAAKYGWSSSFLGIVQSSFLWGYIFSSVIGGALVDKYGGKKVIAWGAALWSLATLLTPWAANHSTISLLAIRAFFGLAEGVALPSMNTLLSRWFPSHERATAVGISMGGFHLGNVVGLVLTPLFMSSVGISGPFILFSSLGLLWLTTWINRVTNDPQESNSITKAELRLIQAGKSDSPPLKKGELPPLRLLLSKMPTWAIIFANVTNNWGYFVLLSWMPVYFKTVFNVNLKQAAWFSAVPWGTMAFSGYVAGAASDFLIKAGYSLTFVRKVMQSIGFIGPGVSLLCLNYAKTPEVAAVMITIALSFSSFSQAGFLLNMQDIAPQYAGFLHGISNSAGTLAAIISTIGTGFFVQWLGSFQAFLTLTACLYFVTAIFWNIYATGERVF
ncbi:PREDICTED: probable anion transporter 3, chloroplastic [Nicotiana attenuata]|uniref:Anion transporter 3, chloroplastic n=1 Tax=Nicotiana attenuata TaxID=49451 RepID=A0A314L0A4_NICAT|nr:PREDICTED: probable anion transporter 3, chloroplastic [Nicotiana attenuata]OIT35020.1 putative anion transporter 3, chloroplastic [Nicotiana attenuata]